MRLPTAWTLAPLAAALAAPGCANNACSCDILDTDSKCVEFTAADNPLYAAQLSGSCSSVLAPLCDTLGGTYTMGTPCPSTDLIASCRAGLITYFQTEYWYSTGGDPIDPAGTEPEDDCSDAGTVTRY